LRLIPVPYLFSIAVIISPDITRQIKSRRMRWVGHVARIGKDRKVYKVWWESPKERNNSKDVRVDGRVELECVLRTLAGVCVCVCVVDSADSG
jgi:hypothetical protein